MAYLIKVKCTNCGFEGDVEIPEGMRVFEWPCPECKTKTLSKAKEEEIKPLKEEKV